MLCDKCGHVIPDDSTYCPECGPITPQAREMPVKPDPGPDKAPKKNAKK